jgi:hypothetical protein
MLIYSRQLTLTGSPRKTMPWAAEITAYVNAHSPLDVSLWSANFGYPIGTVAWTTMVESQAQLAEGTASLVADSGYLDLVEQATDFVTTPGEDRIGELVYGTPGDPPGIGAVAQVTTATAIVDQLGSALAFAVDIAQHIEGVTGSPVALFTGLYGTMGSMTWIGVQPDMAGADAVRAKLLADSSYLDRVAKTKGLFIPGSGHVTQTVRIA